MKPFKHHRGMEHGGPEARGWGREERMDRRVFAHGEMRLVLLALIAEKPAHGYELIKEIEERLKGAYAPSPGLVYPTLNLLEETGMVSVEAQEGGKKLFTIAPDGKAQLKLSKKQVEEIFERMDKVGRHHGRAAAPEIVRAMHNVKFALRVKSESRELSRAQIEAVAKILDEAAWQIERC